ncbi:MAG: hypothetical protein Q8N30_12130 [Methylococcales bacterium]|nr:hypothetical protein [Methylococcales bacterium]
MESLGSHAFHIDFRDNSIVKRGSWIYPARAPITDVIRTVMD